MAKRPKLSIVVISYNQEKYIAQALEGFVSQKTDFDFEIVIADDNSSDKTPDIIRTYANKHKNIRPILRNANIGIQENLKDAIVTAQGEYLALCEGDDFWTDVTKLQTQVDFLDSHKNYALCFHPVRVFFENGEQDDSIFPEGNGPFSTTHLLQENFIQTNSVVYRSQGNYKELATNVMPYDWYLHLFHAQHGKIGYINKVMSAYRRHEQGEWWNAHKDIEKLWLKNGLLQISLFEKVLPMYDKNKEHEKIIRGSISFLLTKFVDLDEKYGTDLFSQAVKLYPHIVKGYARDQIATIRELDRQRYEIIKDLEEAQNKIAFMKASRFWKLKISYDKLKNKRRPHA